MQKTVRKTLEEKINHNKKINAEHNSGLNSEISGISLENSGYFPEIRKIRPNFGKSGQSLEHSGKVREIRAKFGNPGKVQKIPTKYEKFKQKSET